VGKRAPTRLERVCTPDRGKAPGGSGARNCLQLTPSCADAALPDKTIFAKPGTIDWLMADCLPSARAHGADLDPVALGCHRRPLDSKKGSILVDRGPASPLPAGGRMAVESVAECPCNTQAGRGEHPGRGFRVLPRGLDGVVRGKRRARPPRLGEQCTADEAYRRSLGRGLAATPSHRAAPHERGPGTASRPGQGWVPSPGRKPRRLRHRPDSVPRHCWGPHPVST
jgi:hypothetical protein